MIKLVLASVLALISAPCWSEGASAKFPLDAYAQTQIHESVLKIKEAIITENTFELLKYISVEHGLSCTDTNYSYKEVSKFLSKKNSHLYLSLFNSSGFSKLCGSGYPKEYPATSEKEFLKSASEFIMVAKLDEDWVQVTMTSHDKTKFPVWWYLHKEGGVWKVSSGSFIIGDCACGG